MNPHSLASELERLSGEYSAMTEECARLEMAKPLKWAELRATTKTNTEADNAYDQTADGQRLIYLSFVMKGSEKRQSALKAVLRQAEVEARGTM